MKISKPIVFFDIESNGLDTSTAKIVQIACIKIDLDGNQEKKEILINPMEAIPKEATEVHGITDEMVKDAPTFKQISKALYKFFEGCDIAGYNSDNFDVPLLMEEFLRAGIGFPSWECNFVDVLKYERLLRPNKLTDVYKRYTGLELENAHNALADVEATLTVLLHQIDGNDEITPADIDAQCQGERKRFDICGKCYYDSEGKVRWTFGKNQNKLVLEDNAYLNWVLKSTFPFETKNKLQILINSQNK